MSREILKRILISSSVASFSESKLSILSTFFNTRFSISKTLISFSLLSFFGVIKLFSLTYLSNNKEKFSDFNNEEEFFFIFFT